MGARPTSIQGARVIRPACLQCRARLAAQVGEGEGAGVGEQVQKPWYTWGPGTVCLGCVSWPAKALPSPLGPCSMAGCSTDTLPSSS